MDVTLVGLARIERQAALVGGLALFLAGCATPRSGLSPSQPMDHPPAQSVPSSGLPTRSQPVDPDIYASGGAKTPTSVLRTGRYQLVEMTPTAGQRNLLEQTVTIDLPQSMPISVAGGLENVLQHSGLSLCPRNSQNDGAVFAQPLPAVDRQLGPVTLGTALQVLAGPAWRLHVDFIRRRVCFDPRQDSAAVAAGDGTSATAALGTGAAHA